MEPNLIAYLALIAWVPISILLFNSLRPAQAAMIVFVGGYLLLPERVEFDFPAIPPLNKHLLSTLGALAGTLICCSSRLRAAKPFKGPEAIVLLLAASCMVTAYHNSDFVFVGVKSIKGLVPYDGVSLAVRNILFIGLPFLLGRALFRTTRDLKDLLSILAIAAVGYSVLIVWEARMSPQLHTSLYGFHPHEFIQNVRFGGWRPQVFTRHGLVLAMFVSMAVLSGVGLWRARRNILGVPAAAVTGYLGVVLVLCRSVSPFVYAAVLTPVMLLLRPKQQLTIATVLVCLAIAYPALRASPVFPGQAMVNIAKSYDAERAESLQYRFDQEEKQLARAQERMWFGWGGFGRDHLYEPETGKDLTVLDGTWIIYVGHMGVAGMAVIFALLLIPVRKASISLRFFHSNRDRVMLAALGCMLAAHAVDQLPNSSIAPLSFLLCGALTGICEGAQQADRVRRRRAFAVDEDAAPAHLEPEPETV